MSHSFDFLSLDAQSAARSLLGCELERSFSKGVCRVRIVETEAYDQADAASHSYKGRTPRTDVMFGPPGHLYVYFTYGMHYCCNIVVGESGYGAAVLIRAVEPVSGEKLLAEHRSKQGIEITNGPAKLCQALNINKEFNGHDLKISPLKLIIKEPLELSMITATRRIGISRAKDVAWRYYVTNNSYVSHT